MTDSAKCLRAHFKPASRPPLLFIACAGLAMLMLTGCGKKQQETKGPPVVEVAAVIQQDVPVYKEWVGSTDGIINATIRAQVQGYLIKRNYSEGDFVKKGQVLFEIDPRPFQAALDQAKGNLGMAEAGWSQAKANLARIKPLAAENAVSQKDLDDAVAAEQSGRASVQSNQAAVEKARLELGFTKIVSLVDGIAGIAKAQIGDLVGPATIEELTTVSKVDPIKVYISASEQEYLKYAESAKHDDDHVPVEMVLADGIQYRYKGAFILADRQVDPKTGTIKVGCIFKNPGNIIRPGQFARVKAAVGIKKNALLVPQRAVTELQGSFQVATVAADNKVDIRPVKASELVGNLWVIDEGLKPGEKVIAEGSQKVLQGMTVNPKPYVAASQGSGQSPKAGAKPAPPAKNSSKKG
ncbi:MAG TPA: efflux RND transporter periplasmic adaptor subunit [Syntrophorhabdaceae bacterium]|jgi:membrane fusion protein (multidrug efflux system)